MKVLFVTNYSLMYGANLSMLDLIRHLKERHVEITVVIPSHGPLEQHLAENGIKCVVSGFKLWRQSKLNWKSGLIFTYDHLIQLNKIIKACGTDFDLVHSNSSMTDIGQQIARRLRIPHIWHLRENGKYDYPSKFVVPSFLARRVMESATVLVCVSRSLQDFYSSEICPKGRYRVIYNGISAPVYQRTSHALNCVHFCCTGTIIPGKGQMLILQAGQMLLERGITGWDLSLIGLTFRNVYVQEVESYIKDHHMEPYVKIYEYRSDVLELLKTMDVGVMSSKNEAFGRVTVEYMLMGMPVIGTNSGGTAEIIEHNRSGFLFEPDNAKELADYMEYYISHPQAIFSHGEYGSHRAVECFSSERNAEEIYRLYQEILRDKKR